jgi:DNA modification methylase
MRKLKRRIKPWFENDMGKLYLSECTKILPMFKNKIDLVVTSPPYDNMRLYKGFKFDFRTIARGLVDSLKEGGVIVWVVADQTDNFTESGNSFRQALYFKRLGLNIYDTMIFRKVMIIPMNVRRYNQGFEYMFIFSKGKVKTFNPILEQSKSYFHGKVEDYSKRKSAASRDKSIMPAGDLIYEANKYKKRDNVWTYKTGYMGTTKDKIAFKHPATFPEKLARDHIISWSNEGDLVLDPMCGSGTTCKMAHMLNRRWIGIDMTEEYLEITKSRIKGISKRISIFE